MQSMDPVIDVSTPIPAVADPAAVVSVSWEAIVAPFAASNAVTPVPMKSRSRYVDPEPLSTRSWMFPDATTMRIEMFLFGGLANVTIELPARPGAEHSMLVKLSAPVSAASPTTAPCAAGGPVGPLGVGLAVGLGVGVWLAV